MNDSNVELIKLANESLHEVAKVNKRFFILALALIITLGLSVSFMWAYYMNKAYGYTEMTQEVQQQDQNIKQYIK